MKHSVLVKIGALMLITGTAFAVPTYAAQGGHDHGHEGSDAVGGKGETGSQQMSGMMNDMSSEMKDMSGMMEGGSMNPETMKKMSAQMKQLGSMMNHMSGMMNKDMTMDAGKQKQMGQMRNQIDKMREDMPASPMQK